MDDERELPATVHDVLEANAYDVREAASAREALAVAAREPPALVLLDLVLPDVVGFELVQQVRALHYCATVPFIAPSAFPDRLEEARGAGIFAATLPKPVDAGALLDAIAAMG